MDGRDPTITSRTSIRPSGPFRRSTSRSSSSPMRSRCWRTWPAISKHCPSIADDILRRMRRIEELMREAEGISYCVEEIEREYEEVYPKTMEPSRRVRPCSSRRPVPAGVSRGRPLCEALRSRIRRFIGREDLKVRPVDRHSQSASAISRPPGRQPDRGAANRAAHADGS